MSDFDTVRHFIEGSAPFWTPQSHGEALAALDRIEAEKERLRDLYEFYRIGELVAENERLRAELEGATDFAHDKWTRLRRIEEAARKYLDDVEMWEGAADPEPLRAALED